MTELTSLKGIGEKTAGVFGRLGIFSAEELLRHYPREYEEFTLPVPLYQLAPGQVMTVEGVLQKDAALNRFHGMTIVNAYLSDMTGRLQLSWFNAPFMKNTLRAGKHFYFRGRVTEKNGRLMMTQPKVFEPQMYREKYAGHLMPIYSLTKGLTNNTVMKAVADAIEKTGAGAEFLPSWLVEDYGLLPDRETSIRMHFPRSREELKKARERVVFDEFFLAMLAGARLSEHARRQVSEHRCRPDMRMLRFMAGLPFQLTGAQSKAYREIASDMSSGRVMNRLVEGDVGSGKTIVAILAMMNAAFNGYQAAMMAPTAVLARQHYETVRELLRGWNEEAENAGADAGAGAAAAKPIRAVLLTGSMSAAEKKDVYARIRAHEADLIIGTHTLFQEAIEYADLGLIVTDEQHRFGVGQREALYQKGNLPHTLIMSATPIPRTLAMILYSDMSISVIDARPEGRIPIKNAVVGPDYRRRAYRFIQDEIKKGRQAYIICPAIESEEEELSDTGGDFAETESGTGAGSTGRLENVLSYTEKMRGIFPENVRIGMLHGRMKGEEKEAVMMAYKAGDIDLLVSTTVIEVGVDVPNATVMMIENAERFGLAELHQLRGRVGRGGWQSYCIMINTSTTEKAAERLEILKTSNDGFEIAEEDLRLRGPGDIFGFRQSGERQFRVADIYGDQLVMKRAKEAVDRLLKVDPEVQRPEHAPLARVLQQYMERGSLM